jgi:hypothetical protein
MVVVRKSSAHVTATRDLKQARMKLSTHSEDVGCRLCAGWSTYVLRISTSNIKLMLQDNHQHYRIGDCYSLLATSYA